MKKHLTILLSFFLIAFVIYSCKKNVSDFTQNNQTAQLANAAETWRAAQLISPAAYTQGGERRHQVLNALWDKATLKQLKNGRKELVVPAPEASLDPQSTQGAVRKFIFNTKDGNIEAGFIIEMFGNGAYMKDNSDDLIERFTNNEPLNGFTGVAIIYDVNYNYVTSRVFKNGDQQLARAHVTIGKPDAKTPNKVKPAMTLYDGDCYYTYYGVNYFVNGYYQGTDYYLLSTFCPISSYYDGNPGFGGGGGGTTGGNNYYNNAGPTGPASGNLSPKITEDINKKPPPCIAQIIANIISLGVSDYSLCMFADYTSINNEVSVSQMVYDVMTSQNILVGVGNNYVGVTANTSQAYPTFIELQQPYINSASELAVVKTLFHESMHGYFQQALKSYRNDPDGHAALTSIFSDLFEEGAPLNDNDQGTAQHRMMADNYVVGLADMLVSYANIYGIISPNNQSIESYCYDIAWGGLRNTSAFNSLPLSDRNRILTNVQSEQDHGPNSTPRKACP